MDIALLQLVIVIVAALAFDFINGFHDTANAIATVVSTRVLTPRQAVLLAGVLNTAGAFAGTAVAATVGKGIVEASVVTQVTVLSALAGAIAWNLITWYYGIPSSSSHALIGGLCGAALAQSGNVQSIIWSGVLDKVILPMFTSPLLGFAVGFGLMILLYWLCRDVRPQKANGAFRNLQLVSASFMAFSHGSNDAQKTMGLITMALVSYQHLSDFTVPWWVILLCALAMGMGTMSGGWRIIHTMGNRVLKLQPINGFAAETTASIVILSASYLGAPVSTTHVISSAILGVGSSRRLSAVRWGIARTIVVAWVLTIPASALLAYVAFRALHLVM